MRWKQLCSVFLVGDAVSSTNYLQSSALILEIEGWIKSTGSCYGHYDWVNLLALWD